MRDFLNDDDFGLMQMTSAINTVPVAPARIGSMGLFQAQGADAKVVGIEELEGELKLIPTQPRGTMPEYKRHQKAKLRAIMIPHLPKNDTVWADSLIGIRQFDTDNSTEAIATTINNRLAGLKADHEVTWEYHRAGALQGLVKDADGSSTVYDLFAEFGVSRITLNWDTLDITGLKALCMSLRRNMETELNFAPYTGIHVFVGADFFDSLVHSEETRDAFKLFQDSAFAREFNSNVFRYSQITFEEYTGKVGTDPVFPDTEGQAFPLAPRLYEQWNAPGTFMECVGTLGLPYYAKQEVMKFDVGVELHTQSNPLFLVKKPRVLIKLTKNS